MCIRDRRGLDRSAAIAHMRFDFIEKVCAETVIKPHESKEHLRSQKMDKILTGKYTAIPCFAGIMALVFWLTFGVIGKGLSDLLDMGKMCIRDRDGALIGYYEKHEYRARDEEPYYNF